MVNCKNKYYYNVTINQNICKSISEIMDTSFKWSYGDTIYPYNYVNRIYF